MAFINNFAVKSSNIYIYIIYDWQYPNRNFSPTFNLNFQFNIYLRYNVEVQFLYKLNLSKSFKMFKINKEKIKIKYRSRISTQMIISK